MDKMTISHSEMFASPEEIVAEARNGRAFIIVDAEDRENEGDIIIPAQFATPSQVNFMATHGRGLVCVAMTQERASELHLSPMARRNACANKTAFTVSIEAREGVSTGISAQDRARTIAVAIDPTKIADDLVSPGHVFPLVARHGGVLARAGHTEASVDICRLAGLIPAAVICEVMSDDGTMARVPELIGFASRHGLKIGTIASLIEYRRRTEKMVERVVEAPFRSRSGHDFRMVIYRNLLDGREHAALVRGQIGSQPALVRVHPIDLAMDMLGHAGPRAQVIDRAIEMIGEHDGPGVMVFLRNAELSWSEYYSNGMPSSGPALSVREYGLGAHILRDLGVTDMIFVSSSSPRMAAIEGYGLNIVATRPVALGLMSEDSMQACANG
ncbi:3,4-dihydroxy-2-butanone-4-phosphate synthase [Croceicoccus ponticola]|uniref:3,4-dihydroxy-2-butanone 4-phosphate synthase n=1 Tax=Croceicoccus ponticola TaxID=2217664 RepID=A0A437H2M8_9SPHN|nr:3,4-dihydroxy-2-butanone-4-phosphate synthase [Croceicoccus ponticola]